MSAPPYAVDRAGLKARLRGGEATFGTFLGNASPVAAEICAASGVDWVLLDLEHGSGGEEQVLDVVPAAASYGVPTLVRAESTARIRAGRLLDLGAGGVMFPASTARPMRRPPYGICATRPTATAAWPRTTGCAGSAWTAPPSPASRPRW